MGRASTSACAYQMIKEHWNLDAAFCRVQAVRSFVHPNKGFWRQLRDLEATLRAQGVALQPLPVDFKPTPQPHLSEGDDRMAMYASAREPRLTIAQLDQEASNMPS